MANLQNSQTPAQTTASKQPSKKQFSQLNRNGGKLEKNSLAIRNSYSKYVASAYYN